MAIDLDLFSSSNFCNTIRNYCRQLGWNISDINDRMVILKFNSQSGNTQTLFIVRYDTTLEFSVPSGLKFRDLSDIPSGLSSFLLYQNSQFKIGFWAVEDISNQKVISIMQNAEISLMTTEYFYKIAVKLINSCDEMEQAAIQAMR